MCVSDTTWDCEDMTPVGEAGDADVWLELLADIALDGRGGARARLLRLRSRCRISIEMSCQCAKIGSDIRDVHAQERKGKYILLMTSINAWISSLLQLNLSNGKYTRAITRWRWIQPSASVRLTMGSWWLRVELHIPPTWTSSQLIKRGTPQMPFF